MRQFMSAEKLLDRLRVLVEGHASAGVPPDRLDDGICRLGRVVPMRLEPFLELGNLSEH
jgi:hypothetical protein